MSTNLVAARPDIQALQASLIRDVANAGMGRNDVLRFWFGESDQPTPGFIREAAMASLAEGETFYSQNLGRPYLREAIAGYLGNLHRTTVEPNRIAAVGSGVSGLMIAAQMVLSPGDRVVAVTPLWPNIVEIPRILGAEVVRVPLTVANGKWSLDLDRLLEALTPDTRLTIINSPNNPTGWTIEEDQVDAVLAHCRKHGIWVLSDDVYERLVHDPQRRSAPSFLRRYEPGDRIISVNSFSKAWSMTGWRVGWLATPETLSNDLTKVIEYNTSCILEPVQRAATAALTEGEPTVAKLRKELSDTRKLLVDELSRIPGVSVPDAGGAMYVFFRIEGFDDTLALAKRLVEEAGLGLAPGGAFGSEGQGWLRWCHAVDPAKLRDGVGRLKAFLGR
ncbi:MAG TPA: pyridoxal phosphate-dependent aminotransferase [Devosia sp.]|jgi:aspartate/methionine/tyrosine aminotransferase|uniref:pyridoxal phosphate-dependent aminotransferase n=1 Tax=Devosia sp. TaxID=1871048 RepID=UPI002DDCAF11|nr:pyridoxal phosphate-dependent aminotransferase [Devosia sp.]HEV2513901.1 pyridoxal phosphate-dependent aminotransferase [Devosia sp.]